MGRLLKGMEGRFDLCYPWRDEELFCFFFFKQKTAYEMAQESRGLGDVYHCQFEM